MTSSASKSRKKKNRDLPNLQARKAASSLGFPWQGFLIALLAGWIYWPALHGYWMGDDPLYITRNQLLLDPNRLWKAWFQPGSFIEYYPLSETVQWAQWRLWGMETFGYHVTNLVLHIASSLLVWRLLDKLGLRLAWIGGLIFAIHPMQVESVAFINELKNTLSLPPFLLALCCWVDFAKTRESKSYFAALAFFIVAMLAKITMAPFPIFIFVYAWYLRGRISWADVKDAAPFFAVSLALGLLTIWSGGIYTQKSHAVPADIPLGGLLSQVALAGLSFSFYFSRFFLPIHPSFMYPHWPVNPPGIWQFLPWPVLGAVLIFLWSKRQTWGRPVLLGLAFFLIFLSPFLGFNRVSYMSTVWVMDHFLYIPMIGLIGLTVAGLDAIDAQLKPGPQRQIGRTIVCVVLALLVVESRGYAGKFIDDDTLYRYTIEVNPQAWAARFFLGSDLLDKGQLAEAREQLEQAVDLHPHYSTAHLNLALVYSQLGDITQAEEQFSQATQLDPDNAALYSNWGSACFHAGRIPEAIKSLEYSLHLNPADAQMHMTLAMALCQSGDAAQGLKQFDEAERLDSSDVQIHLNHGVAFANLGRLSEAKVQFQDALQLDPTNAMAQSNLAQIKTMELAPASH